MTGRPSVVRSRLLAGSSPEARRALIVHLVTRAVRRRHARTYVRTRWWR